MTTYTIEGRIEQVVTMNICAPSVKDALAQAEKYIEHGAYEKHGVTKKIVSIA
jgi:hypothetical protein